MRIPDPTPKIIWGCVILVLLLGTLLASPVRGQAPPGDVAPSVLAPTLVPEASAGDDSGIDWRVLVAGASMPLMLLVWRWLAASKYSANVTWAADLLCEGAEVPKTYLNYLKSPNAANRKDAEKDLADMKVVWANRPR